MENLSFHLLQIGKRHVDLLCPGRDGRPRLDYRALYRESGVPIPNYDLAGANSHPAQSPNLSPDALLIEGYDFETLVESSSFLEIGYLIATQQLPTKKELQNFSDQIVLAGFVHEGIASLYRPLQRETHPAAIATSIFATLSAFHPVRAAAADEIAVGAILARLLSISSMANHYYYGRPFIYPRFDLEPISNFFQASFAVPAEPYVVNPARARALDKLLVLLAGVASKQIELARGVPLGACSNLYASIAAGIIGLPSPLSDNAAIVLQNLRSKDANDHVAFLLSATTPDQLALAAFGLTCDVDPAYEHLTTILRQLAAQLAKEFSYSHDIWGAIVHIEEAVKRISHLRMIRVDPNTYCGFILHCLDFPPTLFPIISMVGNYFPVAIRCLDLNGQFIDAHRTPMGERPYIPLEKR